MNQIIKSVKTGIHPSNSTLSNFHYMQFGLGNNFGSEFQRLFKENHKTLSATGEVKLFRLVMDIINGLVKTGLFGNKAFVEEFHGSGHQVRFKGDGTHAPTDAICELSDLMTIVYSSKRNAIRLSFIQAKYERKTPINPVIHPYTGNTIQWFLLAKRPPIKGRGKFRPPEDLLSSAILPSVGSFLFFHWESRNSIDMFFTSADNLTPSGKVSAKGTLTPNNTMTPRRFRGHLECVWAKGAAEFATNLYALRIGTPIEPKGNDSLATRKWLSSLLKGLITNGSIDKPVTAITNLLKLLDVPDVPDEMPEITSFGAKAILIIDSDSAYEPLAGELVEMSFLERLQYCSGKTEIQSLLNEAADYVNSLTAGADGNYKVVLFPPESLNGLDLPNEFKNKWIVDASGAVKWKTSSGGAETWDAKNFPTGVYSGNSANEAAEQFLISLETALFGIHITNDTLKGQK